MSFLLSKTFDIITEESAIDGEAADSGFKYEDKLCTMREAIREIEDQGYFELHSFPSIYFCDNDTDMRTGEDTSYALHIEADRKKLDKLKRRLEKHKLNFDNFLKRKRK